MKNKMNMYLGLILLFLFTCTLTATVAIADETLDDYCSWCCTTYCPDGVSIAVQGHVRRLNGVWSCHGAWIPENSECDDDSNCFHRTNLCPPSFEP